MVATAPQHPADEAAAREVDTLAGGGNNRRRHTFSLPNYTVQNPYATLQCRTAEKRKREFFESERFQREHAR